MGKRNRSGQWKIRWFVLKDKLLQYYKVRLGRAPAEDPGRAPATPTLWSATTPLLLSGGAARWQGTSCRGFINLEGASIADDSKASKGNVFKLVVPNRTYYLNVDDIKDFQDWCEAFEFVAGELVRAP